MGERFLPRTGPSTTPVVCLLPVRNGAQFLPAWFESVRRFADAVVALDDGSTDETYELLSAEPLVRVLLQHPRRDSVLGWNDSTNRNELLGASASLDPTWIMSLDADEIVAPDDAVALRTFIDQHAVDGIGYGFPWLRMVGDGEHWDIRENRSYRLFAFHPGQRFPADDFHFLPIPTSIPRHRLLCTDLRIQHLGSRTPQDRQLRRDKYRLVDPAQRWDEDGDYSGMERAEGRRRRWVERPANQPVMFSSHFSWSASEPEPELDWPVLTLVVPLADDDFFSTSATVAALKDHAVRVPTELIVLAADVAVGDDVGRMFPTVTVIVVPSWSTAAEAWNQALGVARGDYVVFITGAVTLDDGALDELVGAHDGGAAVVTVAPDARLACSFSRAALRRIGGFQEGASSELSAAARLRLVEAGEREAVCGRIAVAHEEDDGNARADATTRSALGRAGRRMGAFLRALGGPKPP